MDAAEPVAAAEEKMEEGSSTESESSFAMPTLPVSKPKLHGSEAPKSAISVTVPTLNYDVPEWACEPKNTIKYNLERSLKKMKNSTFYMLGRLPTNDVMMSGKYVSRHHCILQYGQRTTDERPGWFLYDLKTTHGTRVNRRKVTGGEYVRLQSGFYISFGVQDQEACVLNYEDPEEIAEEEAKAAKLEMKDFPDLAEKRKQGKIEKKLDDTAEDDSSDGINWGMDYGEDGGNAPLIELEAHLTEDAEAYYNTDPKKALSKFFDREGFEMKFDFSESGQGHNHKWICSIELPIEVGGVDRTYTAQATVSTSKKDGIVQCALEACKILDKHGILRKSSSSARLKKKTLADNDYFDEDDDVYFDRTGQLEKQRDKRMKWATMGNKVDTKRITYDDLLTELKDATDERDQLKQKIEKMEQSMIVKTDAADSEDQDSLDAYCSQLKPGGISNDLNSKTMVRELRQQLVTLVQKCSTLERQVQVLKPVELPPLQAAAAKSQDFMRRAMMLGRGKKSEPAANSKEAENASVDKAEPVKPVMPRTDFVPEDEEEEATSSANAEEKNSVTDADEADTVEKKHVTDVDEDVTLQVEKTDDSKPETSDATSSEKRSQESKPEPKKLSDVIATWEAEMNAESKDQQKKEQEKRKQERQPNVNTVAKKRPRLQKEPQYEEYGAGCEERDEQYATWIPPENQSGDGKTKLHDKFAGRY